MKSSTFCLLVSIVCSAASVAHADPPAAPAESPRDRLAGSFVFAGGAKEVAAKDAAIEKATESMSILTRGLARSKLREKTPVRNAIGISFGNGNIAVTADSTAPAVSPESGSAVSYKSDEGTASKLSQKVTADGRLAQSFVSDNGTRATTYTLAADGKTLSAAFTIQSDRLPQPIRYVLTYRRR